MYPILSHVLFKFVLNVAQNFLKTNMILKGCDDSPEAFTANFEHER